MYALAKTKLVSVKLVQTCLNLFAILQIGLDLPKTCFLSGYSYKKTFGKIGHGIVPGRATPIHFFPLCLASYPVD